MKGVFLHYMEYTRGVIYFFLILCVDKYVMVGYGIYSLY